MNTFEINAAIKELQEKDIEPELLADTLESLELARSEKLDGAAYLIERNTADSNFLAEKIKRLQAEKRVHDNKIKHLSDFLTRVVDDSGNQSIKTDNFLFKNRNFRKKTVVPDVMKLPVDYVKRVEEIRADKDKIYKDLIAGKEVKGAYLEENKKVIIS